ncbi:MAG: endonuclease/exonuclease/phosphatase family protein [Rhodobacteraceae bacterium]|nr:endonuclease/exonuclease/phosphatase family protein [Paracoccaceae bacterium]
MIKYAKTLTILAFSGGILGLIGGFFGAYHPVGDSLAVFRLYALAALFFAMFGFAVWRQSLLTYFSLGLLCFGIYSLRAQLVNPTPVAGFTLLQHNNLFKNDTRDLVDYARATAPDIITLQEITTNSIPQLAAMREDYPYQVICPFAAVGGVAILSKFRIIGEQGEGCIEGLGMVSARVEVPGGEITVVSLHLHWPWPYQQPTQIPDILSALESLKGPVFIGGDFNTVAWSHVAAQIETASNTKVIGGIRFTKTLFSGIMQLPIDQVLAPANWPASASRGPHLGSDHNSVIAQFALN